MKLAHVFCFPLNFLKIRYISEIRKNWYILCDLDIFKYKRQMMFET